MAAESGGAGAPEPEPTEATATTNPEQPGCETELEAVSVAEHSRPEPIAEASQMQQPEPEPEPEPPPTLPLTVAELLAQASSTEHAEEHLHAYWEDYAAKFDNRALQTFNSKPKRGVELAIVDGLCVEEAQSIAVFLLHAPGLDKTQV